VPRYLHLLKSDSGALALPVIERVRRDPGASVTVVLLHGLPAPALPPGVEVRRLGEGDLDYAGLLDLIFDADHVVAW
jgi:hypothetical protein